MADDRGLFYPLTGSPSGTAGPTPRFVGDLWFCTATSNGFTANTLYEYYSGSWSQVQAAAPAIGSLTGAFSTYTPSVAATAGTITSTSGVAGRYLQVGLHLVFLEITFTITNNGTGSGRLQVSLPIQAGANNSGFFHGWESATTGKMVNGITGNNGTVVQFVFYDGSYPGGTNNSIQASGWYEV